MAFIFLNEKAFTDYNKVTKLSGIFKLLALYNVIQESQKNFASGRFAINVS
jgi:hypothetical protein